MFARSLESWPADVALTLMWVTLVRDARNELMCTHTAWLTVGEPPGDGDAASEGDCLAAEVPPGALFAAFGLPEVQPAISAAPLQVSATTARRARPPGRLGQPDLVIVTSVMLPMHTPLPARRPHPERAMSTPCPRPIRQPFQALSLAWASLDRSAGRSASVRRHIASVPTSR